MNHGGAGFFNTRSHRAFADACEALERMASDPKVTCPLRIVRYEYDCPYYAVEAPSGMQLRRFYDDAYLAQ